MTKKIKNIPKNERPREKLLARGAQVLRDEELIAVLLGRGTQQYEIMSIAEKVLPVIDEKGTALTVEDLCKLDGIGEAKAASILAAVEFTRRRVKPGGIRINEPPDIVPHIRHYADRNQEHFICVSVNGANEVINIRVVTIGLIDRSTVHPREVFADAITDRASSVILAHNHPIGDISPSREDIETTKRLRRAGEIMGITVLDHIILQHNEYFSFVENGVSF